MMRAACPGFCPSTTPLLQAARNLCRNLKHTLNFCKDCIDKIYRRVNIIYSLIEQKLKANKGTQRAWQTSFFAKAACSRTAY